MKTVVVFFVNMFAVATYGCPDLSGYYESTQGKDEVMVTHLNQTNCDQITLGFILLNNGTIVENYDPAITYYNSKSCGAKCYTRFEENAEFLRIVDRGIVEIPVGGLNEKYQCHYDYLDYSLTEFGDLRISFPIISRWEGDPCGKIGIVTEVLIRTKKP